jgi:hypothetical protein
MKLEVVVNPVSEIERAKVFTRASDGGWMLRPAAYSSLRLLATDQHEMHQHEMRTRFCPKTLEIVRAPQYRA